MVRHGRHADERHGAALALEGVTVSYPDGTAPVSGVDLALEPGEIVALLGASGSGKSTIAKLLTQLERPTTGRILLNGKPLGRGPRAVRAYRDEVQMVFQHGFGIKESYRLRKEKAALQHEKHEQPENEKEETA